MPTMPSSSIPFRDTNFFSELICDYLDKHEALDELYSYFPSLENFEEQIKVKKKGFPQDHRDILEKSLINQYQGFDSSIQTHQNIISLKENNTFTIVTGHQLNLFSGPLYFLYKIISTINLCKHLKKEYPKYNFVPIYWMASEDHDFEEINFFNFQGRKVQWTKDSKGAVGRLSTEGLNKVYEVLKAEFGSGEYGKYLTDLFKNSYLENDDLRSATRHLANELFKDEGLVIVDGDDKSLKNLFVPYLEKEIKENLSSTTVEKQSKKLSEYKIQVNPREINLFYLTDEIRSRIVEHDGEFSVVGDEIIWTKTEIIEEINAHPERFSPNVILRPLYQEVILPNLCYIGGGGELAYWLQLREMFDEFKVDFPILLLRNSVLLYTDKEEEKLKKLGFEIPDLFNSEIELKEKLTQKLSKFPIDLSKQKEHLEKQFEDLYKLAEKTDKSFVGAVAAQERKQIKGLEHLEKRLMKAQKRKFQDELNRLMEIREALFPGGNLQERKMNFSEFYLEYGPELLDVLKEHLNPLDLKFSLIKL